jgi:hypothetical protein
VCGRGGRTHLPLSQLGKGATGAKKGDMCGIKLVYINVRRNTEFVDTICRNTAFLDICPITAFVDRYRNTAFVLICRNKAFVDF